MSEYNCKHQAWQLSLSLGEFKEILKDEGVSLSAKRLFEQLYNSAHTLAVHVQRLPTVATKEV